MSVRVSAPGKVLITGGYLILERPFTGLVLSLSSRFQSTVEKKEGGQQEEEEEAQKLFCFEVHSPQFGISQQLAFARDSPCALARGPSSNSYVVFCIQTALQLSLHLVGAARLAERMGGGVVHVTIQGDNEFYSQEGERGALERFAPLNSSLADLKKTGLGSSAALTTSLMGALLHFSGAVRVPSVSEPVAANLFEGSRVVHNAAQYAHCKAQGKIGSGFDVSSACYGSQCYERFDRGLLEPVLEGEVSAERLAAVLLGNGWNNRHDLFALPEGLVLVMGDISEGSNTPKLVSKVLAWRQNKRDESNALWKELGAHNEHFKDTMEGFGNVRAGLKRMGQLVGVEIEPDSQTDLCDATERVPGVVCCGVPGAGGFDAVFALLSKEAVPAVEAMWKERGVVMMHVEENSKGVRLEE